MHYKQSLYFGIPSVCCQLARSWGYPLVANTFHLPATWFISEGDLFWSVSAEIHSVWEHNVKGLGAIGARQFGFLWFGGQKRNKARDQIAVQTNMVSAANITVVGCLRQNKSNTASSSQCILPTIAKESTWRGAKDIQDFVQRWSNDSNSWLGYIYFLASRLDISYCLCYLAALN